MVAFSSSGHKYFSPDNPEKKWTSVTSLIGKLSEPFDREGKAKSCSTRKPGRFPNKWYGYSPEEILAAWDGENQRSLELGTWYHSKKENELYTRTDTIIHKPLIEDGLKIAPDQRLQNGIYPEHFVYLESSLICGQSDKVEIADNKLYINDHKTSKEIARKSFVNYEGAPKMMLGPVKHLEDCDFNHYALQLSLYAYIIRRHNPNLDLGGLTIEHVHFVQDGENKYGYPIYKTDDNGEPVIKDVELIEIPYMLNEVLSILQAIKNKRI